MEKKFISFLGLARKAGRVLMGLDSLEKTRVKVYAVLTACDAAERTLRNAEKVCPGVKVIHTDCTKAELGRILGAREVSVTGITDKGFAEQIILNAEKES